MTSTFTPNLNLELMGTGDQSGNWGAELNNAVFSILDNALGNTLFLPLSNANVTLTTTQCQNAVIYLTGTLTTNVTVTFPGIGRIYAVYNGTSGAFTVTLKNGAGGTVAPRQGRTSLVALITNNVYFLNDALGYNTVNTSAWGGNTVYIGWGNNGQIWLQVDGSYFGGTWPMNISGNANTASSVGGVSNPTAKNTLIAYQSGIAEFGGVITDGTAATLDLPSPWVMTGLRTGPSYTGGIASIYPRCRALMTQ